MPQTIDFRIRRQDNPQAPARWEEFSVPYQPNMNVISCLMEIQRSPVTREGKRTSPPVWDCNCLEEVCGACSMVVNGRVRQACSALIDHLAQPIVLEPMSKFPLIRDLMVDRSRMFDALQRVRAWIPIDGTHALGPGPKVDPHVQQAAYAFARCMTCGCCLEACPQVNARSPFMGAFVFGQVDLFNMHPTGGMHAAERLEAVMGIGGIADCANAQNCAAVCPKEIPLTEAIADLGRQTTRYMLRRFFTR
ncbi:MAG TPA: succinate dehydrogenase iron-sulfur subunit [Candidatus Sulfotelmatobacter sp.]|nr:succinate dehydrogenase iron-sulfur subunit [Candidatus Sulfotelmatobacter sp.]